MGSVNIPDNTAHIAQAAAAGVNDTLSAMDETLHAVTPVDTGLLVSSYVVHQAVVSGTSVRGSITNDTPYYVFVNYGTVKMAARNMSGQAIDRHAPELPANIARHL